MNYPVYVLCKLSTFFIEACPNSKIQKRHTQTFRGFGLETGARMYTIMLTAVQIMLRN